MEKTYWLRADDNTSIYLKKWYNEIEHPRAIVQISHGMAEHIGRYTPFARYLTAHNIFVYGHDHRGHGKTSDTQGILGFFSERDGFVKTAEDIHMVTAKIRREYPDVPLILFGHSMGSFLARKFIQTYSNEIDGLILSGTGYYHTAVTCFGKIIARTLPPKKRSKLMNTLAFGSYNRKFRPRQTDFDWLSSDQDAVRKYIDDPYAGFLPTARFFYDLMSGLREIHCPDKNKHIRKDLPMFIMSGDNDPVGNYGKGVWKTAHLYDKAGIKQIATMLFENSRHELLNEKNKTEVYHMVHMWISHLIQQC